MFVLLLLVGGITLQAQTEVSATSTTTTSETKTPPASSKKPLPEAQWVEKSKTTTCDTNAEKPVQKPRDAKAEAEKTGIFIKPTSQTETKTTVTTVKPVAPKKEAEKSSTGATSTTSGS